MQLQRRSRLEGCLIKFIVYNAEVISNQDKVEYIGLAANNFKERFLNHISSFRNVRFKDSTALSNYIWNLKDKKKDVSIKWSIAAKAPSHHPVSKLRHLCLTEKTLILTSSHQHLLNKRNERMGTCRHRQNSHSHL